MYAARLIGSIGGYPKFISQGLNDNWFFPWVQDAGYNTYYTGKLFNAHTVDNYNSPFPAGFTGSVRISPPLNLIALNDYLQDFLLDPYTYQYYNSTFQRNKEPPILHPGEYQTDLIAEKAYGFLHDAIKAKKPFFLAVAPTAPHANVKDGVFTEPLPAKRHEHLFPHEKVPRTESFNPEKVEYRHTSQLVIDSLTFSNSLPEPAGFSICRFRIEVTLTTTTTSTGNGFALSRAWTKSSTDLSLDWRATVSSTTRTLYIAQTTGITLVSTACSLEKHADTRKISTCR
jgi:hypothetical protein